jgi:hypothetical protein
MSGISYDEVIRRQEPIPTMVVMGAGIDLEGLSERSKLNAYAAAGILLANLAPMEPVITVGDSSGSVKGLKKTEADEMAKIIETITFKNGLLPYVVAEDKSTDTIQNLINIGPYIEEFDIDEISIVASIGHADRAKLISKKLYGRKLGVLPVYSTADAPMLSRSREVFSIGLYGTLTAFAKPETRRLDYGNRTYRSLMNFPKKIASKSSLSRSH